MTELRARSPSRLGRSRACALPDYARQPNEIEDDRYEGRLLKRLVGIKAVRDA